MMQSNSSKIQTRPIEDLIGRIRALRQKGERQIIIPAKEADQLADSLTQVMTRMVTIQEEIIEALKTAKEAQTVNIEMDGGEFSEKKITSYKPKDNIPFCLQYCLAVTFLVNIHNIMSRPKPTVLLQHSNKSTFKMDEVLAAEGIWAVFYDGKPINLKSSSLVANYPGPKYKKVSFSNPGHAENLAKKLNAQHNTDKFGVYLLKTGDKFSR